MTKNQKLDPETAASNIAKAFSEEYAKSLKPTEMEKVSQLYETVYKEVYKCFLEENHSSL